MNEKPKFVTYRGVVMIEDWPEKIEAAQKQTHVRIGSVSHERLRYGFEDYPSQRHVCGDCGVHKGEYHVQGCDVEQCPVCGEQAFDCDCNAILLQ